MLQEIQVRGGGVKKQPNLSGVGVDFSGITQSSYCIRLHPLPHQVLKYSFHVVFFFSFLFRGDTISLG